MKKIAIVLLLFWLVAPGCIKRLEDQQTDSSPTRPSPAAPTAVAFQRVTFGARSSRTTQGVLVATNDHAYNEMLSLVTPDEPVRSPNFTHEMAVAVFLGERPTSGFRVRVTSVTEREGVITIEAVETTPASTCIVLQVLTQPFEIVALPRQGDRVELVITRQVGPPC